VGALQPMHLIIVLGIVLLIFGPGKLPQLGRAIGDGMRELKLATSGDLAVTNARADAQALPGATCASCNSSATSDARFCGDCGAQIRRVPAG